MTTTSQRRKRGTGSIHPHPGGRFRAMIRLRDGDGNSIAPSRVFDTEAEAESWLNSIIAGHHGGSRGGESPQSKGEKTFTEFMRIWLTYKYESVSGNTDARMNSLGDYESLVKLWMIPKLGTIQMSRLHWDNISDWLKWLRTTKSEKTGSPLGRHQQRRIWVVFKQAISYAVDEQYCPRNPIGSNKGIKLPPSRVKQRAMKAEDFQTFRSFIREKGCQHLEGYCALRWELAYTLARRQGEVLALKWSDIYTTKKPKAVWLEISHHIIVRPWIHGCQDLSGAPSCGRKNGGHCPKRHSGGLIFVAGTKPGEEHAPNIPLTSTLQEMLNSHKNEYRKLRKLAQEQGSWSENLKALDLEDLVFVRPKTGTAWAPSDDNEVFKKLLKESGVTKDYRLHDLRHTAVTHLLNSTGNISTAQRIAGHRTITTTQSYVSSDLEALLGDLEKTQAKLEETA